ncbi:formate-dependent phosphoribosylglycinamide formyltransferase [Gardnerella sp. KA00747]|uniref:formate-dependent phosphoribosylglycinamide formyltransferase n=1 Tax=Gardnerella sp. KA00747 TaxID=2749078 RepID=UPI003BA975CF
MSFSEQNQHIFGVTENSNNTTALLLGSGELGKEIAIELMRLGVRVCAADSYENAPAMQIAHEYRVLDMSNPEALQTLITQVQPNIIIPEVEAIATKVLAKAASQHIQVVPSSDIAAIAMDRERLRTIAHEDLGLPTTPYRFASSFEELEEGAKKVGYPCVVKPVMSSSGHGQSVVRSSETLKDAWDEAQHGRRAAVGHENECSRVIVEALAPLDYELTVLTVSSSAGITTCEPIAQRQQDGDYRESWQPANIPGSIRVDAQNIAKRAVEGLTNIAREADETGWGVYGVELFVLKDGSLLFNELSPRPHDTGMVTMISQHYSEFALHVLAILGVPVTANYTSLSLRDDEVAASHAIVVEGEGEVGFTNISKALQANENYRSGLRIFAKPSVHGHRRMAVALATGSTQDEARKNATRIASALHTDCANAEIL